MPSQVIGVIEIRGTPCLEYAILRDGKPYKTVRFAIQEHLIEAITALPGGTIVELDHAPGFGGITGFRVLKPAEPI